MEKQRVLFVCVHNSARSQMAEAFLTSLGGERFETFSAGLTPGTLNQDVVRVMKEIGIDISGNRTKGINELLKEGKEFDVAVMVCDESHAGLCPVIPGVRKQLHWSIEDPSGVAGSEEVKQEKIREIRDQIRKRVILLIEELSGT